MVRALSKLLARPPADAGKLRLPDGMRVYAVGDIHGRLDRLREVEAAIAVNEAARPPAEQALVVMLGDYVDRGPDSRGVLEVLSGGSVARLPVRCVRGNHEAAMLRFLAGEDGAEEWLAFGGLETLESYGVRPDGGGRAPFLQQAPGDPALLRHAFALALPDAHRRFVEGLPPSLLLGDCLFVHAGVRPGVPLEAQVEDDLLWIRDPFLSAREPLPWRVIHGHTIVPTPVIGPYRISIDTGAYAGGPLTCVVLEGAGAEVLGA